MSIFVENIFFLSTVPFHPINAWLSLEEKKNYQPAPYVLLKVNIFCLASICSHWFVANSTKIQRFKRRKAINARNRYRLNQVLQIPTRFMNYPGGKRIGTYSRRSAMVWEMPMIAINILPSLFDSYTHHSWSIGIFGFHVCLQEYFIPNFMPTSLKYINFSFFFFLFLKTRVSWLILPLHFLWRGFSFCSPSSLC